MRRGGVSLFLLVVATVTVAVASGGPAGAGDPPPEHTVSVTGTGVSTYPAFDESIGRYAVRTGGATNGAVTVAASTTDPGGTITVDGRPLEGGSVDLTGLEPGDEVAVQIVDGLGTSTYAFIHLPAGFPLLTATSTGAGPAEGHTFLGLIRFFSGSVFEVVVDEHGVPIHVRSGPNTSFGVNDFKRQPNGRYTVARRIEGTLVYPIAVLDERFEEIETLQTVGLENTDFHDSILLENGNRILTAYEPRDDLVDAVIQEIDPAGNVVFEWSSEDHIPVEDALVDPLGDYAHINSVDVMENGDWLASFRNTSQVLRIARTAHDGFAAGDVVWRLGGLSNEFTFVDDPHGGPCAQHTAYELTNGNILLFDNGAQFVETDPPGEPNQTGDICPDPNDPGGDRIARPQTRAAEYAIDDDAMTATLVWSHEPAGQYSQFAGSTQRLANGNTLIGWADDVPLATEVDAAGDEVWELESTLGYLTYRAFRFPAPDAIDPEVDLVAPADDATFERNQVVTADYGCTDRGGSSLADCGGPSTSGAPVDTSTPGEHEFTVTATDGAGNTTEVTHTYTVSARRPDARIRRGSGPTVGDDRYNTTGRHQTRTDRLAPGGRRVYWVTIQNDGDEPEVLRAHGQQSTPNYTVRYRSAGADVTAAMRLGTFQTRELAPGEVQAIRVVVRVGPRAPAGSRIERLITARSSVLPGITDVVRVRVIRR